MADSNTPETAAAGPGISKDQAKKILKADLANMVKKVGSGKTLSSTERAILNAISEGEGEVAATTAPNYVSKQSELATLLGFKDRKTIQRLLREPENPGKRDDGRYDVASWKAYARRKGHQCPGDEPTEDVSQSRAKAKQILLQNKRLENRIAIEMGEWIPKSVARQVLSQLVTEAKARSFNGIIRIVTLARLASGTSEAAAEVRKEMESIWQALTTSEWYDGGK